ncbi:MAG TPA: LPS assembly lipoprotein LptE [Steroidobacteraceae bacterium]|nr:LPS assembly lipoprotein LptE [Steroidobacteraceae bacterium]
MKGCQAPFPGKWCLAPFFLLIAGCGFHLQGRQPLPAQFSHTYVDTRDEQTDFVQDLRKALIASKVDVIPTKNSSTAVIQVHEDELTERILSVSAQNIPTEYELTYKVTFSVLSEGKTLIEKEEISATRDISFDEAQLLAKEREQEILRAALARDLVALVMRRLAAL